MREDHARALVWGCPRIGDAIMSLPALKILRAMVPNWHVTYSTTFYAAEILRLTDLVDELHCYRLKGSMPNTLSFRWFKLRRQVERGSFDEIFVLGKLSRYARKIGPLSAARHTAEHNPHRAVEHARLIMDTLGVDLPVPAPHLKIAPDPESVEHFLRLGLDVQEPYLVVHSGCNRISRSLFRRPAPPKIWPTEKYGPLFRALRDMRPELRIVMVGTRGERSWIEKNVMQQVERGMPVLNLAGRTTIPQTVQLLRRASCLLCGDSGVMHMGTLVKTPMVALFGPTNENRTGPFGMGDRAVRLRSVPLEEKDPESMRKIPVEDVAEAIENQLTRFAPTETDGGSRSSCS